MRLQFNGVEELQTSSFLLHQTPDRPSIHLVPRFDPPGRAPDTRARRIPLIGGLIQTADEIARFVDSVLGSMEFSRNETHIRLQVKPNLRNFSLMMKMSRPLDS